MFSKTLFLLTRPASLTPHSGQASLASEQSCQRMSPSGHWSITAGGQHTTPHPQHSSSFLNKDHHLYIFILFLRPSLMSPIMSSVLAAAGDATDKGTDDIDEVMSDDSISTGAVMLRNSSSRRKSSFFRNSTLSATVLSSFFFSLKNKCQ